MILSKTKGRTLAESISLGEKRPPISFIRCGYFGDHEGMEIWKLSCEPEIHQWWMDDGGVIELRCARHSHKDVLKKHIGNHSKVVTGFRGPFYSRDELEVALILGS